MENASKALIMAGSILISVMIISIGVYLYSTFRDYGKTAYDKIESTKISEFNAQFLKYYGNTTRTYKKDDGQNETINGPILCTAHDIITLAGLAKENNYKNFGDEAKSITGATQNQTEYALEYIRIDVDGTENLQNSTNDEQIKFIKENSIYDGSKVKYFICKEEPTISNVTKKVCYMKFVAYDGD